mmetsp:Transcript_83343/g.137835  ORF Transcript_83343/g.137835 Transcript_83343/m.137835 type:complete len:242 (+) Transcript_83343:1261-1986(+)
MQQEVQLPEAFTWLLIHFCQSLIMQRDCIQLRLIARRHVVECILGRIMVLHHVLNSSLEIEGLDKSCLLEYPRVANTASLKTPCSLSKRTDAELWMVAHPALDDLSNVLDRWAVLLHAVVAKCDVVCKVRLISCCVHGVAELLHGICVTLLFPQQGSLKYLLLFRLWAALIKDAPCQLHLVLLVRDSCLEEHHALRELRVFDRRADLRGLLVHACLHQALHLVNFVFVDFRASLHQLRIGP